MEHHGDREGCRRSTMMSVCELFIKKEGNYSGMLIGRLIAIMYFLARKNSLFGYSMPHVPGSSYTVKFMDSGSGT